MSFITAAKSIVATRAIKPWSVLLWLTVWQLGSMALGQEILLVSPITVVVRVGQLALEMEFWRTVLFSFARIAGGFLLAAVTGSILAALASRFRIIEELVAPPILAIKAIPVASFIILVLIWVSSKNLSILIAFLMVLPIIYTNVFSGIRSTDPQLLEMAQVFQVPTGRRIRYIYVSQVLPYFRAACSLALGLCWKSGIAAEVIGIPKNSMGEKLYSAKIYLDTPDLFAWTVVIVLVSLAFEKIFLALLDLSVSRLERM